MISAFLETGKFQVSTRKTIIHLINGITYLYITGDAIPDVWDSTKPFECKADFLEYLASIDAKYKDDSVLGDLFVSYQSVDWSELNDIESKSDTPIYESSNTHSQPTKGSEETPKENLWLKPRDIPRYIPADDDAWMKVRKGDKLYTILKSYPVIPTRQRDITITTEVNRMADSDIDKLYPKQFIRTRKPCMYEPLDVAYMHEQLGLILKICDFTREQVIDNIIKYPHLYIIRRVVDGASKNFFADIEIDGTLYPVMDVWDTLDDTKNLPKTKEFIQEYVIRRYLLERDIKHIEHKYPMDCNLQPYLTLFMPKSMYAKYGYTGIGRDHVKSRVSYLQSLNPMLRSIRNPNTSYCVTECPFADQCTDQVCDEACPKRIELTYLLERNRISLRSSVFQTSDTKIELAKSVLHLNKNLIVIESASVVETSTLLAYIACCERWKGNCLNCSVYHLSYSDFVKIDKKVYNTKGQSDELDYMNIWMDYANILIISDLEGTQIAQHQATEFIQLLRSRERAEKKTIIVSPKINELNGSGQAFETVKRILREAVIR